MQQKIILKECKDITFFMFFNFKIFPWFMWIMGVSMPISIQSQLRNSTSRKRSVYIQYKALNLIRNLHRIYVELHIQFVYCLFLSDIRKKLVYILMTNVHIYQTIFAGLLREWSNVPSSFSLLASWSTALEETTTSGHSEFQVSLPSFDRREQIVSWHKTFWLILMTLFKIKPENLFDFWYF